ncbi:transmembrane protein [Histomonas meleagridis]|uniref:uncharacterized protein n=1 Tax=Histomonas meleagridis TaxID=135588 RepID=UPI00355A024C|nr:transmembrane protein [Histomonas meleagridis]KAH0805736.1 transmembrane protein [Histomonas meleagridis]
MEEFAVYSIFFLVLWLLISGIYYLIIRKKEQENIEVQIRNNPPFSQKQYVPTTPKYRIDEIQTFDEMVKQAPKTPEKPKLDFLHDEPIFRNTKKTETNTGPKFIPYRKQNYQTPPQQSYNYRVYVLLVISASFLIAFLCRITYKFSLTVSLVSYTLALITHYLNKDAKHMEDTFSFESTESTKPKLQTESPSSWFAREPPKDLVTDFHIETIVHDHPYQLSDRATSSLRKSLSSAINSDTKANETLKKLGITTVAYNKYLSNFKYFISQTALTKLVQKVHSDESIYVSMLSVPGFEHCRGYIIHRIKALASSQYLSGHFGDGGDRYEGRDWTSDLPSDNQIIMHIIAVWISYFMSGKNTERVQMLFYQKCLFIRREPMLENDDDIALCTDDFANFYVYTRYDGIEPEKFFTFPGRDSMYAGMMLFFWFVMKKKNFLLGAADLTEPPICMDRIFSLTK